MNATDILDQVMHILKEHLGEEGARNVFVSVYDQAVFFSANDHQEDGWINAETRICVCENNCRPVITDDISDARGADPEAVLADFEKRIVPQIKRAWKGVHCGFDPVLLGC
jgi:hypothetical protein